MSNGEPARAIVIHRDKIPIYEIPAIQKMLNEWGKKGWIESVEYHDPKKPKRVKKPVRAPEDAPESAFNTKTQEDNFEAFWIVFDYKKAKQTAWGAWKKIKHLDKVFSKIMYAAKIEARNRPELIAKGSTPKWAQGWINEQRWTDVEEPAESLIKHNKDEPPKDWQAKWEAFTGEKPPELDWFKIDPQIRKELMEE